MSETQQGTPSWPADCEFPNCDCVAGSECFREPAMPPATAEHLLPCPFCGGESLSIQNLVDDDDYFVSCDTCEVQQIANYTRADAIERWNRRIK